MKHLPRIVTAFLLPVAGFSFCGCNLQQTAKMPVAIPALQGKIRGGQQPISGSRITLYAAGTTQGYGYPDPYTTGTDLLGNHVVTTDANGNFNITGDYTCPSASTQVYLAATGGNPGLSAPNPNIVLLAALGPCGNLTASTFILMNEVTTVATVYALAGFMTGPANVGAPPANAQGLINAFATVNKLANIATGTAGGPALPAGATLPVAKINTLADILAACVNSPGGAAGDGSVCGNLFSYTMSATVTPKNTVVALLNLVKQPNMQTGPLTDLVTGTAPFQPALHSAPSDYGLVITHTGGGLATPKGIAVDAAGNVWLPNSGANSVTKLNNLGVVQSGANGFTAGSITNPTAIAIDISGDAWITNGNDTVTKLSSGGTAGATYTGGGLSAPASIAIDALGSAWIANSGNPSVTQITNGGVLTNYTSAGITGPVAIAIAPQ